MLPWEPPAVTSSSSSSSSSSSTTCLDSSSSSSSSNGDGVADIPGVKQLVAAMQLLEQMGPVEVVRHEGGAHDVALNTLFKHFPGDFLVLSALGVTFSESPSGGLTVSLHVDPSTILGSSSSGNVQSSSSAGIAADALQHKQQQQEMHQAKVVLEEGMTLGSGVLGLPGLVRRGKRGASKHPGAQRVEKVLKAAGQLGGAAAGVEGGGRLELRAEEGGARAWWDMPIIASSSNWYKAWSYTTLLHQITGLLAAAMLLKDAKCHLTRNTAAGLAVLFGAHIDAVTRWGRWAKDLVSLAYLAKSMSANWSVIWGTALIVQLMQERWHLAVN